MGNTFQCKPRGTLVSTTTATNRLTALFWWPCVAQYKFTMVDFGAYGREGDRHVYNTSIISKNRKMVVLASRRIVSFRTLTQIYHIASLAMKHFYSSHLWWNHLRPNNRKFAKRWAHFQLQVQDDEFESINIDKYLLHLMCRLSRARRVIENALGISAGRWKIFRKPCLQFWRHRSLANYDSRQWWI